jgi:hypothetical protein
MANSVLKLTHRFNKDGAALVGYAVTVSMAGGNIKANLYGTNTGTTRYPTNVLITDSDGKISCYVQAGAYRLTLRAPGVTGIGPALLIEDPVTPAADGVTASNVEDVTEVNTMPYAASITPVASKNLTVINVGVLTGPMTVAPVTGVSATVGIGKQLIFMLQQDATGGRVVTWDASFSKAADAGGTANQYGVTKYVWNGTKWLQIGGALTYRA